MTDLKESGREAAHLALDPAGRRTITLRDADGRPIAGARLAPRLISAQPGSGDAMIPDELADRLEVTTGPDGRAELTCLMPTTLLFALRVALPSVGEQVLRLPEAQTRSEAIALELKPAGRLAGRVVFEGDRPAPEVMIEVWSRSGDQWAAAPVRFASGPICTAADGTFRTPRAAERDRVPRRGPHRGVRDGPLRVGGPRRGSGGHDRGADARAARPLRGVSGRVVDRRGGPIAGAEVLSWIGGPSTTTDAEGRFRLDGLMPDQPFVIVHRDGFRIDGRLLEPGEDRVEITLARFDEPPTRTMTTLPDLLPLPERRKLARRVLDPYLNKLLAAETIPAPDFRAFALIDLVDRLPEGQRARKIELLDWALLPARAVPRPVSRLGLLSDIAERLLELGETGRAKALFAEGQEIAKMLPPVASSSARSRLAMRLARADLPAALALIETIADPSDWVLALGNAAARLAASDPAAAERLLDQIRGGASDHRGHHVDLPEHGSH